MCNTAGTLGWIRRLTWPGLSGFRTAERHTLYHPHTKAPQMFTKSHEHLTMYWVLDAGHVVPVDAPEAALRILEATITGTYFFLRLFRFLCLSIEMHHICHKTFFTSNAAKLSMNIINLR